jgi:hypothetical protein
MVPFAQEHVSVQAQNEFPYQEGAAVINRNLMEPGSTIRSFDEIHKEQSIE